MADDLTVGFDIRTPPEADARANIAINEAGDYPEAVPIRRVIIVGSGPSARHEPLWARLRANPYVTTVALNGALSLFLEKGIKPNYWAACDPQERVTSFLPVDPPRGITYLVATKCHPNVFARLQGRDARKWRLDDYSSPDDGITVPCACSITLVAQSLFRFMGFNTIETYGWDCCFLDGEHHASIQKGPKPDDHQSVELRRESDDAVIQRFDTTGTWMAEVSDAVTQASNFRAMGVRLSVHGPGFVGAVLRGKGLIA